MCGIFGIFSEKIKEPELYNLTKKSLNLIKYRGPDKTKIVSTSNFCSGVNRLSIEALKYGEQPVEDKDYIIGFNGEIFNYKEIIKKYNFDDSNSLSEVKTILKLWILKKENFINEIKGQYAIFIFDKRQKKIFLFRDPFGIRPVYYHFSKNNFIFSSEIKAIIKTKITSFSINPESLNKTCMFWTNVGDETSFTKIKLLEPGKYLIWSKNKLTVKNHYNFPNLFNNDDYIINPNIYESLKEAVNNQVHGEVKFGCYLSGGIDSSALTYLLSQNRKVDTFSVEFENKEYDESEAQKLLVKSLNTNHHSLKISTKDISQNFSKVINHAETFLFRTAPVPMYLLSKFVNKLGFKVIYSGEGADEILFGYDLFFENRIRNFWKKKINSKYRPLLLKKLYNYLPQYKNERYFELIKDFYKLNLKSKNIFYSHLVRWQQYDLVSSFFNLKDFRKEKLHNDLINYLPNNFKKNSKDKKAQYLEITTLLSNYLLSSQGDRMSMANSVEGRYPFLDEKFVNDISNIDPNLLAPTIKSKKLFREAFRNKLPSQILDRPKVAYQAPEAKCFVDKDFTSDNVIELIDNIKDLKLINKKNFMNLIKKFKDENTSQRMGFRENMSLILALSYSSLNNSLKDWSK